MIRTFVSSLTTKSLISIHKRSFAQLSSLEIDIAEGIPVLAKSQGNARTLILNRPKRLNALNVPLVEKLLQYLKDSEKSKDIHLILLKGQGRALGAGADIKDMLSMIQDPSKISELDHLINVFYEVLSRTGALSTPLVTIMNGITVGGACSLGVLARFNIATENTKVIMPETRFGHFCDVGSNFYLPRLSGNTGKYIALTAQMLHAEDVLISGLATHYIPSDRLASVENSLINLTGPSEDIIRRTIENFAINPEEAPESKIFHGKNRDIIDK